MSNSSQGQVKNPTKGRGSSNEKAAVHKYSSFFTKSKELGGGVRVVRRTTNSADLSASGGVQEGPFLDGN